MFVRRLLFKDRMFVCFIWNATSNNIHS